MQAFFKASHSTRSITKGEKETIPHVKETPFLLSKAPTRSSLKKQSERRRRKKRGRYERRVEIKLSLLLVTREGRRVIRSGALFLTIHGTTDLHCNDLPLKLHLPQFVINTAHPNLKT